jgi:hypothetical protein
MNPREKRPTAQDVFNEGRLLFGERRPFEAAFPQVEECVVTVEEEGQDISQPSCSYRNPAEYINCQNTLCCKGGFNIGGPIREMVKNKETQREGSAFCQGNEGSPQGRRVYKKCRNFFQYKISIKYRAEWPTAAAPGSG